MLFSDLAAGRFGSTERPAGGGPVAREGDTRVEDGEEGGGDDDHAALEDHEGYLRIGELAVEALAEFGDTEAGADEDGEGGCS